MSTPANPSPKAAPAPPDERFWQKWSPHHEFPLSTLASIAIHIVVIGLFLIYIAKLMKFGDDKSAVPIRVMSVLSDSDGTLGGPGSGGGDPKETVETRPDPTDPKPFIPDTRLAAVQPVLASWAPELAQNPDEVRTVANLPNLDKLGKINDELRKQLAKGVTGGAGKGPESGKGDLNQKGKADGGPGDANSTARRTLRWTIQFSTTGGRDYLDQLQALKATLLIPQPPNFNKANIIRDLSKANRGEPIDDVSTIKMMFFVDDRRDSVMDVADALELGFRPPHFIAFFPKDIEEELAKKERTFHNRNANEIISTTFRVLVRDGKYTITVTDQAVKR